MPTATAKTPRFKTVQIINPDYAPLRITQYESIRTGMRAVVVDQKGPKVNGYFALATEIHDDSGAPHTLEHLCFMGSKSYQYKGLLDKLATRAYSTTNAWTAVEQTAYTLDTAGWAGFAQILPVYLEHVIVPTLKDAACYTEVHHIDGEGNDAGVVYSEMQGVQNTQEELMELQARRLLYPDGNGFRYETGGMMEQLRVLTADRIREFHKEMYQPKNLCLVLTGEVDHDDLLGILDRFEDTIQDDVPAISAPFKRPWVESGPTPPLSKAIVQTVDFPEEDESMGEILVGFFGPSCNNHIATAALGILLIYLCGSSISELENVLVEKEQLCSAVIYHTETRSDTVIWFQLAAVETSRLAEVHQRLIQLLDEAAERPVKMSYMHDCITRWRRQIKMKCENDGTFFAQTIIDDHLFGNRDGRDLKTVESIKELEELEGWSDKQWREFMSQWLSGANHVSILGKPSHALSQKITKDEQERVKAQRDRLGEDGLKKKADQLKAAQAENDTPIPDSVLEKFPVPDAKSVHFISTTTARAGRARRMGELVNEVQQVIDKDEDLDLFIHFEHVPSNFVQIKVDLCTGAVPLKLKPLLTLYIVNFFGSPVVRNGERLSYEDVVLALEKETVDYGIDSERANSELLSITFQTEPEYYQSIITWVRTLMYDAIHDPERLYSSLTKILADIPDEKRNGDGMVYSIEFMLRYDQRSSVRARNTLSKALYLKRIRKLLEVEPDTVVHQFAELCKALHRPENLRIFIAADVKKLPRPVSAWKALIADLDVSKALEPLDNRRALMSPIGKGPGTSAVIVPMSTIDSSYALLTGRGPDSYDHPDLPATMVARAYMDAVEGPLWVAVRGTGLAYGTAFIRTTDLGLLMFKISRSPDPYKAFLAAKDQVEGYATGRLPLDKFALQGAVSEIVLGMADEQPTMASAAEYSFASQVIRGIGKQWSHAMLTKVQAVQPEQIRAALQKYFVPVFRPESSNLVITCAQIMREQLEKNFGDAGYKPEVRKLDSFQDPYGLEAVGGEDDVDDDEDEDEDEDDEEPMDTPESEDDE